MKVELSRFIILGMFTAFHRLDSRDDASLGLPGRMTTGMVGAMFGIQSAQRPTRHIKCREYGSKVGKRIDAAWINSQETTA
jgi:hypothetical protein